MVNKAVFLEKTEALRSSKYIGNFEGHNAVHSILPDDLSKAIVKQALQRLKKSSIDDAYIRSKEETVGWLRHPQIHLGDFLGKGAFSSVYAVKYIRSQDRKMYSANDVVVKFIRPEIAEKPRMLAATAADLVKEGLMLASMSHENVISVKAWTPTGLSAFYSGRADSFFLVLERLQETLKERLQRWAQVSKKLKYTIQHRGKRKVAFLKQQLDVVLTLAEAVKYVHSQGILHRDLKPDNIGFHHNGTLKLFDFDVSRTLPESSSAIPDETFAMTHKRGSCRYMSPECALGQEYNLKSDVYSFSVLCHEIMSLEKPYNDIRSDLHHDLVFCFGARPLLPDSWPEGIKSLLRCCFSADISLRPSMEEAHRILEREIPRMVAETEAKHSKWAFTGKLFLPKLNHARESQIVCSETSHTCCEETRIENDFVSY
jgi:serine/threonine protein kinase